LTPMEKTFSADPIYFIDDDQLRKLRRLADQLQGGSDRERDYGHRLWLLVSEIEKQSAE
jgi:hypothetical protein